MTVKTVNPPAPRQHTIPIVQLDDSTGRRNDVMMLRRVAVFAVIGLAGNVLARVANIGTIVWSIGLLRTVPDTGADAELMASLNRADALVDGSSMAITISFIGTGIVFLFWVHRLVSLTCELGTNFHWRPHQAVWAFVIPIVSLFRPYQVLTAVEAELDPNKVPAPAPRVDPSTVADYRNVAFVEPPPPRSVPAALIGAWWGMFVVMTIGSRFFGIGSDARTTDGIIDYYERSVFLVALGVVAGILAITVVRGLTALAEERVRRLQALRS